MVLLILGLVLVLIVTDRIHPYVCCVGGPQGQKFCHQGPAHALQQSPPLPEADTASLVIVGTAVMCSPWVEETDQW